MKTFTPGLIIQPWKDAPLLLGAVDASYIPRVDMDNRSGCLEPSDQGMTSECVAYALAGWIEFHRWQDLGIREQIDPHPIYAEAKKLDGMPGQDGTTLEAGLDACANLGLLKDFKRESVRQVGVRDVRRAMHQYGAVLGAFVATENWQRPDVDGWIKPNGRPVGGHAVLLCCYNDAPLDGKPFFGWQDNYGMAQGYRGFVRCSPEQLSAEFDHGLIWDCTV